MKLVKRTGLILLVIVVIMLVFARLYLDYPLPEYEGELTLKGLQEPVEVFFDEYAVPHIYAANEQDLFFAAGYIMARERLFQMTVTAATVEGRLSELFGKSQLENDIFLRTWGIAKAAKLAVENMAPQTRDLVDASVAGVNRYIDDVGSDLPVEFKLLGIKPIRWEAKHATGYGKLMAYFLNQSWYPEILYGQIRYMFGDDKMKELRPFVSDEASDALPPSAFDFRSLWEMMSVADAGIRKLNGMRGGHLGSNNWVIGGERTVSGKPILANDPHLEFSQPAKWYEMHLVGGRFNVSGACLTGIPLVVLGQNNSCAWGFTNLMTDDVDFYLETINPQDPNQYLYDGEWRDIEGRKETIAVKGAADTTIVIRQTHHGPIISDIHYLLKESPQVLAFRWVGHEVTDEITALMKLNLMSNWDEFTEATKTFAAPGQNVVYADVEGNIGWRPMVWIPTRKGAEALVPLPGESSEWDWQGFVPYEELPYKFNPPDGLIITANHQTISNDSYYVSNLWIHPSRYERIAERLGSLDKISPDDVAGTQLDVVSPYARETAQHFVGAYQAESLGNDTNLNHAIELLRDWDGSFDIESTAATLFSCAQLKLMENIYADEMSLMGDRFFTGWIGPVGAAGNWSLSMRNLKTVLERGGSSWVDNVETTGHEELLNEILRQSLEEGVREVESLLGPSPHSWAWGKIHTLSHPHTIGNISGFLDGLFDFNVGPFPSGGSSTTINNGEYKMSAPFDQIVGASFRRIVDFSNFDRTRFILPTGQSGLPKSPHYADQAELYINGQYRTTYYGDEQVRDMGLRHLVINPVQ
ncbi:MAG: penicillin acylase family protein [Candidatus Marinimicrobia bacterium]|jgi:penicillin amidase|nr:penicillin acylase family protein [Candidatus Neomarinimicrobiota bacterium]MDP6593156.1 penicillin acylase family protein [Candidatus Neomarinimicrobiota bacterium]|tara:strand:+ start:1481 stop:3916 length:2436 start_codon:yes stop_codon:yes gene_type:complete